MHKNSCKFILKTMIIPLSFFLVIFFGFSINTDAAYFKYKDFNWEEFAKDNENYWGRYCDKDDTKCKNSIISTQKKFYTRLYKILASYEKNGLFIDDLPIILTVYYGYMPDRFNDKGYLGEYFYEDDDVSNYFASFVQLIRDMFGLIDEKDTVKLLVNAMTGYERTCYGQTEAKPVCYDEDSNSQGDSDRRAPESGCYACGNTSGYKCSYFAAGKVLGSDCGSSPVSDSVCVQQGAYCAKPEEASKAAFDPTINEDIIKGEECKDLRYECKEGFLDESGDKPMCNTALHKEGLAFYEVIMDQTGRDEFMGIKNTKPDRCEEISSAAGYSYFKSSTDMEKKVLEYAYWTFLKNSTFFDKREYLQYRYLDILNKTGHSSMTQLTPKEYEKYDTEIKAVRQKIIDGIQSILRTYGRTPARPETIEYIAVNDNNYDPNYSGGPARMWWPIGSEKETEVDGKLFASDMPQSSAITSHFGPRDDPFGGGTVSGHGALDIGATQNIGDRSIIAAEGGVVTIASDGCRDGVGDYNCGGGYGNWIEVRHDDGVKTRYAHLQQGSIIVHVGDRVEQGQIMARIGNSGSSTGPHLHFEVRIGETRVDPEDGYVNINNPRPGEDGYPVGSGSGDLAAMLRLFEGHTPIVGNSYKVTDEDGAGADPPTVGIGVTLIHNYQSFAQFGFDLSRCGSPNDSFAGCVGTLIPMEIVDRVKDRELESLSSCIKGYLSQNGISLTASYQMDALVHLGYNAGCSGAMNSFVPAYKQYGSSINLCQYWWDSAIVNWGTIFETGHQTRRRNECDLFVKGRYNTGPDNTAFLPLYPGRSSYLGR